MNKNALADAIVHAASRINNEKQGNVVSPFVYATFVAAEGVDADLSQITLSGGTEQARYVPKLAHVTGLSAGQTLLCIKGRGVPLTIIGRVVGNIALASA